MSHTIIDQLAIRPPLPQIFGCQDYREERELLERIDEILRLTDADRRFQLLAIGEYDRWYELQGRAETEQVERGEQSSRSEDWKRPCCPYSTSGNIKQSWLDHSRTALRVNILRYLRNDQSLRAMSYHLSDSALTRWFCHVSEFGPVRPPSKSTIDRYEHRIDSDAIRQLVEEIMHEAGGIGKDQGEHPLELKEKIDLLEVWWDATCLL